MLESGAAHECAFCAVRVHKVQGICGVNLYPDRITTRKDIPALICKHQDLDDDQIIAIIKAHNSGIASLFRRPPSHNPMFNYPYWYQGPNGLFSDTDPHTQFFQMPPINPLKGLT